MNKSMTEAKMGDVDFEFFFPKDDDTRWRVRLLSGLYAGLTVEYVEPKIEAVNQKDGSVKTFLHFLYDVHETPKDASMDVSSANTEVVSILGNILTKLVFAYASDNEEEELGKRRTH